MAAWNALGKAFNESPPNAGDELKKYNDNLHNLRTNLIAEVAKSLGKDLDSLKLHKGGYRPQGWQTRENEEQMQRQLMTLVLLGKQPIKVYITDDPEAEDNSKKART